MTSIMIAAGVIGVLLSLVWVYCRRRVADTIHQRHCMTAFYKAAFAMIEDDRTPDIVIQDIERFSHQLRDPRIARRLLHTTLSGDLRRAARHHRHTDRAKAIQSLPPELSSLAAGMFVNYVFSASYSSLLAGPLVRRTLFQLAPERVRGDDLMKQNAFSLMGLINEHPSPAC
jgi:hypothetical protein